jgi:hypothetical protein
LHGDCLTVTENISENLATLPDLNDGQEAHEIQKKH